MYTNLAVVVGGRQGTHHGRSVVKLGGATTTTNEVKLFLKKLASRPAGAVHETVASLSIVEAKFSHLALGRVLFVGIKIEDFSLAW